jgi:nucleoid-associated protein
MSLQLKQIAIHHLIKDDNGELNLVVSCENQKTSGVTESFANRLHSSFVAKKKIFARFDSDSEFEVLMCDVKDRDFLSFSGSMSEAFKFHLNKYPFAYEGTLVFLEYRLLATDYLYIGLIPSSQAERVKEDNTMGPTEYLDVDNIKVSALINLSDYESNENAKDYITIAKGKSSRSVKGFFFDFLGAEPGMDSKIQNLVLCQSVIDFCSSSKLDPHESLSIKKQVVDYCKDQSSSGEDIAIGEISGELPCNDEGLSFYSFVAENGYELEENFPADNSVIKKLTKYIGSGGGLNISFDSLIFGERVFYDPETDTLTIKGTPPNLKHQLLRN